MVLRSCGGGGADYNGGNIGSILNGGPYGCCIMVVMVLVIMVMVMWKVLW